MDMKRDEVQVVKVGAAVDSPGPMKKSGQWDYPFRVVVINHDSGLQSFADRYQNRGDAISQAMVLNGQRLDYYYVLDLSALPPIDYPI